MKSPDENTATWGHVAVGVSGGWEATLNERMDRDGVWLLELSSPSLYVTTPCDSLEALSELVGLLCRQESDLNGQVRVASTIPLSHELHFHRDDESASRCQLVFRAAGASVRVDLTVEDQVALAKCLEEILTEAAAEGAPASDDAAVLRN